MLPHQQRTEDALRALGSSPTGISSHEAARRLSEHGPNLLKEKQPRGLLLRFLDQFRDFMILVLIAAALVAIVMGEVSDTIAILVIVMLNAVIGLVQEWRAERAMAVLKRMVAHSALVVRDGRPAHVPASELVPGDVVVLQAGEIVPADLRLTEVAQLKVEEAALTGESLAVEKHTRAIGDEQVPLGDRRNMAYKGTIVSHGRGRGLVTGTGMATELGRIATLLQDEEEVRTPLQKRLAAFGGKLALAVLAICAIVLGVGLLRGEGPLLMLLTAISLAVAAIPEALPAVVTIALAHGATRMVAQKALIRRLPAVETLGSVTYICADKTGTLTQNRMTVERLYADGQLRSAADPATRTQADLLTALALSNDAESDASGRVIGDPTEVALRVVAQAHGFEKPALERRLPRVAEIPFDSDRKCMTTIHRRQAADVAPGEPRAAGGWVSYTKGAVEALLPKSSRMQTAAGFGAVDAAALLAANDQMSAAGLRVLAIAMRTWDALPAEPSSAVVEDGLTLLGLVGMLDPPREEAAEAVRACQAAGIRPVMITGDHPVTAATIARRLGILDHDERALITGAQLARLAPEELAERVKRVRVYARVAPEQKLAIVKALQQDGQFVAMTGDGVNDAPALKRADIGVAMGVSGTDVAKEASDMILLDDNFATIVKAVKEGRRIFDNLRKFIKYAMTGNSGEIWVIFLAPFLGLPMPLLPIHILWVNLVTDGLPGLALAAEPAEKGVMQRPPRHPRESVFSHGLGLHIVWCGLLLAAVSLVTQAWALSTEHAPWQTMVFTVLCLSQMGHILAIRSESESFFTQRWLSNKPLLGAILLTFALQMATIYVPPLHAVFKTEPLSLGELLATLALSSVVFFGVELEKLVRRRRAR